MKLSGIIVIEIDVTIQQVCAHAALTVRTHRLESKNPISEADLEWIFARNYEGTEQLRKTELEETDHEQN